MENKALVPDLAKSGDLEYMFYSDIAISCLNA